MLAHEQSAILIVPYCSKMLSLLMNWSKQDKLLNNYDKKESKSSIKTIKFHLFFSSLILDRFSKNFNKFLDENALGDDEDEEDEEADSADPKNRELIDELIEDATQQEAFARVLAELAAHQPAEPVRTKSAASGSSASGTAGKKRSRPASKTAATAEAEQATQFVSIDEEEEDPELAQVKKARRSASPANDSSAPPSKHEDLQLYKVIAVPFDDHGQPQLPLSLNMITIHALGNIIHDRPAYHNKRYILPVGFHSSRPYLSCLDANNTSVITYHSTIVDNGSAPLYQVSPEGHPDVIFSSTSSTGAWAAVAKAVSQLRGRDSAPSVSGPDYFGLSNPTVSMLIERLPGAHLCEQYAPKRYEVSNLVGGKGVKLFNDKNSEDFEKQLGSEKVVENVERESDIEMN